MRVLLDGGLLLDLLEADNVGLRGGIATER
jgi:hypothetical protein